MEFLQINFIKENFIYLSGKTYLPQNEYDR